MKISERFLSFFLTGFQALGVEALVELFDKLYEENKEEHSATLRALYIGCGRLMVLVKKTKTKFDDSGVEGFMLAIEESAEKYGVTLGTA